MNTDFKPLNPRTHLEQGWQPNRPLSFAGADIFAPITPMEISVASRFYPLAFAMLPGNRLVLAAVLGMHAAENLFVNEKGRWQVAYVPSAYRAYPFTTREAVVDEERRSVLCFDHASGLFREHPDPKQGEERFFEEDGTLRPMLQKLMQYMVTRTRGLQEVQTAATALAKAGLLEPWTLDIDNPDPEKPLVKGFYRINQAALDALDGETLKSLRDAKALSIAYAQILSQPRTRLLCKLYELKNPGAALPKTTESIDALFGEGKEDDLKFDWNNL